MTVDTDVEKGRPEAIRAVPVRHPGRWVAAAVVLVLVAMFVHFLLTSDALDWAEQRKYILSIAVLKGVRNTILLTIAAMIGGVLFGTVLALMRLSPNPLLSSASWFYLWFFRGTPLYTQLLSGARSARCSRPSGSASRSTGVPHLADAVARHRDDRRGLGLILNEAAYMAEIIRAGILSVDEGQQEAASALGMSRMQTMGRIVLPQAMRVIIPPTGNEALSMMKNTSLVAAIPFSELTFTAQTIYANTYKIIPMLVMACLWYLLLSSLMMVGQHYRRRHFSRGVGRGREPRAQRVRFRGGGGGQ